MKKHRVTKVFNEEAFAFVVGAFGGVYVWEDDSLIMLSDTYHVKTIKHLEEYLETLTYEYVFSEINRK